MRTIIWFIVFWLSLILFSPIEWYVFHLRKSGQNEKKQEWVTKCVNMWASMLLKLAGVKVNVKGKENIPDETCIFVSNHQGNFDIPVLLTSLDRPNALLAKKELDGLPFVKGWMNLLDCVFIDRDNIRKAMEAINKAIDVVKSGRSMIIFPEGTRSKGGPLGQFKGGAFRVCEKSGVKLVPIAMNGSYKVMEQNKGIWIKPAEINVTILPPVDTKDMTREEIKSLADTIRDKIAENIH